jgi:predicted acetyltransferase
MINTTPVPEYPLRKLTESDLDGYFACLGAGFAHHVPEAARDREVRAVGLDRMLGAFDGDEIVGTTASYPLELTLPGLRIFPVAGVTSVAVLPTHRRRGVLRSMMVHQLHDVHGRGESLAALTSSEGGIYGRFGYGASTFSCGYEIDKRLARLSRPLADLAGGSVRMVTVGQAEEAFPLVQDAARRRRPGDVCVLEPWWEDYFHDPEGDFKYRFYAVYEEGGQIDGWVGYDVLRDPANWRIRAVDVNALVTVGLPAYAALWSFLLGIDLTTNLTIGHRPVDEPLRLLRADGRQLRTVRRSDSIWMRLVDVRAALAARAYPNGCGQTMVLDVTDDICPWNVGRFVLEVGADGTADVGGPHPIDAAGVGVAHLSLDVSALGAIYLGGVRPSALVDAGLAAAASPAVTARADVVFSAEAEPYCSFGF